MRALVLMTGWVLLVAAPATAQEITPGQAHSTILVVDTSSSMSEDDGAGTRKIDGAKVSLLEYLGNVESGTPLGLRTYPDPSGPSCNEGRRVLPTDDAPLAAADPAEMSREIRGLQPSGNTPTAEALRAAARDLTDSGAQSGTLVLVSDGKSNCTDPCEAARQIAEQGLDLETLVGGFNISDEGREELECISNALNGRYVDLQDSDALADALDDLSRPRIEVRLDTPAVVKAVAGGDPVDIRATITNTGGTQARDVIAQYSVESDRVYAARPIQRLGNLDPKASRQILWRVRASAASAGERARFLVRGRAVNATVNGLAIGELQSIGVNGPGPILQGPGSTVAILGDSYSSGEGGEDYGDTDTNANACHRSPHTYLVPRADEPGANRQAKVIACSGAVTADMTAPNYRHKQGGGPEPAQIAFPGVATKDVRAVVMTIGGNDVEFSTLATSCIVARESCTARVYPDPLNLKPSAGGPFISLTKQQFFATTVQPDAVLRRTLERTYQAVHGALNSSPVVKGQGGRGAIAPILVLGYPIPTPLTGRNCAPMGSPQRLTLRLYLLTAAEIDVAVDFVTRLNAAVESAVETTRRKHNVPVFYVPTTELAFQPSHTFCDTGRPGSGTEPYARSLRSVNGRLDGHTLVGLETEALAARILREKALDRVRRSTETSRDLQEIAHPNARGYEEETYAIWRWTHTQAATTAKNFLRQVNPAPSSPTTWRSSETVLGPTAATGATLQGGTTYPLQSGGFAPNSQLRVEVRSEPRVLAIADADGNGRLRTRIAIPRDLAGGEHTLLIRGRGRTSGQRVVEIRFEIDRPWRPSLPQLLTGSSTLITLLGACLLLWSRRALNGTSRRCGHWRIQHP